MLGGLGTGALGGLASALGPSGGPPVTATPDRTTGPVDAPGDGALAPDELLVGVAADRDPLGTVEPALPADAAVVDSNETLRFVTVRLPEGTDVARRQFADAVGRRPGVTYVEPNSTYTTALAPNDPQFGNQYAPGMVDAPTAWNTTLGSSNVTIAIVDTGIEYGHPDLSANFRSNPGRDFHTDDADPAPDTPSSEVHGTLVTGVVGAVTDNGTGVAGISDCELIAGRAIGPNGQGTVADIAAAVEWATDEGADVVNLSFGGGGFSQTLKNVVSYAHNNGCLPVAAAGMSGQSGVAYPAAFSECLAVSAVDSTGAISSTSNTGPKVELAAPGVGVFSTTTQADGSYAVRSGTSMATAVVSGVAGLVQSVHGPLSPAELRNHLKGTATDLGIPTTQQGCGLANAGDAVATTPANRASNCVASPCGNRAATGTITNSLSGPSDADCWTWAWSFSIPCEVVVELSGPSGADFDLYVNEAAGSCPTPSSFTHSSTGAGSQETVAITTPYPATNLWMLVDSASGSGSYTLEVTEKAT